MPERARSWQQTTPLQVHSGFVHLRSTPLFACGGDWVQRHGAFLLRAAHSAQGAGQAFRSEVGRAGEFSGQGGGPVRMYRSGTQFGERDEKAGVFASLRALMIRFVT